VPSIPLSRRARRARAGHIEEVGMMVSLTTLWLPILLSAVAVFVASSVIHMVIRWHNHDYSKLPDEDSIVNAIRSSGAGAGEYVFPSADDPADNMKLPEIREKWERGPAGMIRVFPPGQFNMGKNLVHWFVYCVVVSLLAGYVGGVTLGPGAEYMRVFQVVSTAAFLAYAGAVWQDVIWFAASPANAFRAIVDGLIYGLVTAGVFGWLWP
jgi:hypothetical protein